jgi:hypothetical protein
VDFIEKRIGRRHEHRARRSAAGTQTQLGIEEQRDASPLLHQLPQQQVGRSAGGVGRYWG